MIDPDPVTQGGSLSICVTIRNEATLDLGILSELKLLQMTQESQFGFFITQDNAPSPEELTMYNLSLCLNGICQVKFQVLGRYFEATDLPDLFVNNCKMFTETYRQCRKCRALPLTSHLTYVPPRSRHVCSSLR